jgi:hypothetical protein
VIRKDDQMGANPIGRDEYIRDVLRAYCNTPGTTGSSRRSDRLLAAQLYERGAPLIAVENALVLASARRLFRANHRAPLNTIRSLAYFVPVIEEVLELQVDQEYFNYLRRKIEHILQPVRTR